MTQRPPEAGVVIVIGEENTCGRSWRSKATLGPLSIAMTVSIDVLPSLGSVKRERIITEPNDVAIESMKLYELLVECAVTLVQMTNDGKGNPEFRTRESRQRVEVDKPNCLNKLIYHESDAECSEERVHDLMVLVQRVMSA